MVGFGFIWDLKLFRYHFKSDDRQDLHIGAVLHRAGDLDLGVDIVFRHIVAIGRIGNLINLAVGYQLADILIKISFYISNISFKSTL